MKLFNDKINSINDIEYFIERILPFQTYIHASEVLKAATGSIFYEKIIQFENDKIL